MTPKNPKLCVSSVARALKLPHVDLTSKQKWKLLLRSGLAHVAAGDLDAAERDFKAAQEQDPEDAAVKKELSAIAARREEQLKKQRAAFSKMFS